MDINQYDALKEQMVEAMFLVKGQHLKTLKALKEDDRGLASEVMYMEKRINSIELSIDLQCEKILALLSPLATDLRLITATMKINLLNERLGDVADDIATIIESREKKFDEKIVEELQIFSMYESIIEMLEVNITALSENDPTLLKKVFVNDSRVVKRFRSSIEKSIQWAKKFEKYDALTDIVEVLVISHTLETATNLCRNIAEEILFSYEASVVKHIKKKEKLKVIEKIKNDQTND